MEMKQLYSFLLACIVAIIALPQANGQEISPLQIFTPEQTGLGNQNWMISQAKDQTVFFANNQGLVSYNGAHWKLHPALDNSIARSVKVIDSLIYSSSYRDFGYWEKDEAAELKYTSLSQALKIEILEDEQFWNIIDYKNAVVFQSLNRLVFFEPKSKEVYFISTQNNLLKSFNAEEELYIQIQDEGLYRVQEREKILVSNAPIFKDQSLVQVVKKEQELLIFTQEQGVFHLKNKMLSPIKNANKALIGNYTLYSAIKLKNNNYALGTVGKGLLILSEEGNIIEELNQKKGLSNNTVLSLFEDSFSNLWLGLDNGINLVNRSSAFKEYVDVNGQLGSIYTSALQGDFFYLGTNQGLFVKRRNSDEDFQLIEKTQGQVWTLTTIDGQLFCGHNRGAFKVTGKRATQVSAIMGTWLFKQHPTQPNLIFLGNFTGLYVIEKKDNQWIYRNKIKGFDISSRFFEFSSPTQIIVNHEYKGVFKIQLDQNYQKATSIALDKISCISCNSSLVRFDKKIYYQAKENVYQFDLKEETFIKNKLLNEIKRNKNFTRGKLINDSKGQLWLFTKNNLYTIKRDAVGNKIVVKGFTLNERDRKNVSGFEHINLLKENRYLIGTNRGYLTVDLSKVNTEIIKSSLNSINVNNKEKTLPIKLNGETTLSHEFNNLNFKFSSYSYNRYGKTHFQYLLEGEDEKWSEWSEENTVSYANLGYGKYRFKLRSKGNNLVSDIISSPTLYINPPWYLNRIAISIYAIILILLLIAYNEFYKRKLRKQRHTLEKENKRLLKIQNLEAQKEIIKLKNDQLKKDIEGKSRELAIATMSTLKRNEFLNSIKAELETINGEEKTEKLIKNINTKLKNNDDWEYFKKAFDNTDQALFSKLKEKHPSLTKNDLKLCAYLRLNLSSKEIAPLLNISVHSVEIKRYRLRKKMALVRSQGIVEYIMTF